VRTAAPALLPVFRSRLQGVLLAMLLGHPEREWTLEELARTCEEPYQTVSSEIRRLQSGGIVATRVIGRSKLVRADESSPYFAPLTQLALMSFGPPLVVAEELAVLAGVEQAFIFGSWAARYDGKPGPAPNDVDVLLVGTPDRDAVDDAARRAQSRLGREVNVTLRSRQRWDHDHDAFTVQLRTSPLLQVLPTGASRRGSADKEHTGRVSSPNSGEELAGRATTGDATEQTRSAGRG
jgi:predicted nucleotidyltransferase